VPELLFHSGHGGFPVCALRHVHLEGGEVVGIFSGGGLRALLVDVADKDFAAFLCVAEGYTGAEA
jgi:hypothetical protein